MHWQKTFALLLLMIITMTLTSCSGKPPAVKHIRYAVGAEPQTLDPRKSTGTPEANIEAQLYEGLTSLASNIPLPAAAERWEVSADGLVYTFQLRANAKWSNGDPVTARDFEFAWKSALDPKLASEYAYQLYYLKNGEAYNKGTASAADIGVKALSDHTLQVTLEQPTAYFLSLVAFHTYYPVHQASVEKNDKWAGDAKTIISNGPFKMINWIHNNKIELAKNEHYWDAAKVKMNNLDFILTENGSTELAMFENNQLDMGGNPPVPEIPRLLKEGKLQITPFLGTYFYCFNTTKAPFDNPKVRKALTLAIDRHSIIKNIAQGEQQPALAWVPTGLSDVAPTQDFRATGGNFFKDNDIAAAKQLLAEAGYPDGQGFPAVTLIYNTSESHKAIAEAIQEMWKKNLGIQINLANQEWKVFISSRHNGDYQIARHGWIGDYADPMTFIDMFTSDSGNNNAQYHNSAYDALVKTAKTTTDPVTRMKAMHDAEKLLMEDAVVMPIYFYTKLALVKPTVKGYTSSILGMVYLKEAYLE